MSIEIVDCEEPLVDLASLSPKLLFDLPGHPKKEIYLRKTVALMLKQACDLLPDGYKFILRDAWRSEQEQKNIFQKIGARIQKKYPDWNKERLQKEVEKYVAPHTGSYASGHRAGAAIDIRLWKNGKRLPMKSSKLTFQENAKSGQAKLPSYLQQNRKMMFEILEKVGFANYPEEFWHWSYGDIEWAKQKRQHRAIYGTKDL